MFRITPRSMTATALFQNQNQLSRLSNLQNQASSGLKYARPSDNPQETNKIDVLSRSVASLENQQSRIQDIKQPLNNSVTRLLEANNLITRAKQIALQAPQSLGQADRDTLIAEVDSIIDRLLSVANSNPDGQYLYSGNANNTQPFQLLSGSEFAIPAVQYLGSNQDSESFISESISIQTTFSGEAVFGGAQRAETLFLGTTGARPGTGTDSHIGRANLIASHVATTYSPAAGVVAGTSSPAGDTVIGPAGQHKITIADTSGNGTSGVISLNNGTEFKWDSSNTDLRVTGPFGKVVFVDTTSVTAGFDGDVSLEATGALSTDGGASQTPIDFSSNQVIVNSVSGAVTNVDSTNILRTGTEPVEFNGSADALTALLELKDDLLNTRGLSVSQLNDSFERRVGDLDRVGDHLLNIVGVQSVSLQNLESLSIQNEQHQLEMKTRLGDLVSADLATVIVEMQSLQTNIQFNYAALSITQSNNLLDFLG